MPKCESLPFRTPSANISKRMDNRIIARSVMLGCSVASIVTLLTAFAVALLIRSNLGPLAVFLTAGPVIALSIIFWAVALAKATHPDTYRTVVVALLVLWGFTILYSWLTIFPVPIFPAASITLQILGTIATCVATWRIFGRRRYLFATAVVLAAIVVSTAWPPAHGYGTSPPPRMFTFVLDPGFSGRFRTPTLSIDYPFLCLEWLLAFGGLAAIQVVAMRRESKTL